MSGFQTAFVVYAAVDVHAYDYAAQNPGVRTYAAFKKMA